MAIRITQVKSVCTGAELRLVEASRLPALNRLSLSQVRQHAQRARKAFDKWQDTSRSQSRAAGSRGKASEDAAKRSVLKAQIFREALTKFEARLTKLEAAGTSSTTKAGGVKSGGTRSASHRATRSNVRATLSDAKAETNQTRRAATTGSGATGGTKATSTKEATKQTVTDEAPAATESPKAKKAAARKKKATRTPAATGLNVSSTRQQAAKSAAKQARVNRTGLTSRVRGHVSARGKRKQAGRDSKR